MAWRRAKARNRTIRCHDGRVIENNTFWMVVTWFSHITRCVPSQTIVRHVFNRAMSTDEADLGDRLLELAVEMANRILGGCELVFWDIYGYLFRKRELSHLFTRLTQCMVEDWRLDNRERLIREREAAAKARSGNVALLMPKLEDLRVGQDVNDLHWAAQRYFEGERHRERHGSGVQMILEATDNVITDAILEGWRTLATGDLGGIGATELGEAEGKNTRYVEVVALAGLVLDIGGRERNRAGHHANRTCLRRNPTGISGG